MLEGLNAIDWSSLQHAYGPADDVPGLLLALLDDAAREGALHALHGNIFHQGTRYPATPHAVPFLVEIVNATTLSRPTRQAALTLLTNCCAGWLSPNEGPDNADGSFDAASFACDTSLEIRTAIDDAAAHAIATARALLDDAAPALRARAAAFLSLFRTRAAEAELVAAVERRLTRERAPAVRATLAFALGHLLPAQSDAALRDLVDPREHAAVRVMAAILLVRRGVRDDTISQALVDALSASDDVDAVFISTPLTTDGIASDAARAMGLLGTTAHIVPALTKRLRTVSSFQAVYLLETALGAAFPQETTLPSHAAALTESQRALLLALVDNDEGLWGLGDVLGLLAERGMPSDREAMAAYLGVTFVHDQAREALRHAELMLHTFHDAERALEHAERALTQNPKLGRAHLVKGLALLEIDDVDGALAAFRDALPLVEGDELMLARKNTAFLLGQPKGLPFLEQNVTDRPGSSVAWYDLGLSLVKAGEHGRCIEAIARCLAIQPDLADAHYTMACAYALRAATPRAQADDVERALGAIKAAVELDDDLTAAIRNDEDFAGIRHDPRFVALVGDHT